MNENEELLAINEEQLECFDSFITSLLCTKCSIDMDEKDCSSCESFSKIRDNMLKGIFVSFPITGNKNVSKCPKSTLSKEESLLFTPVEPKKALNLRDAAFKCQSKKLKPTSYERGYEYPRLLYSERFQEMCKILVIDGEILRDGNGVLKKEEYDREGKVESELLHACLNCDNVVVQKGEHLYVFYHGLIHQDLIRAIQQEILRSYGGIAKAILENIHCFRRKNDSDLY